MFSRVLLPCISTRTNFVVIKSFAPTTFVVEELMPSGYENTLSNVININRDICK